MAVAILFGSLKQLALPLSYSGDSIYTYYIGVHVTHHFLSYTEARLGAPFQQETYDFPYAPNAAQTLSIFVLSHLSHNPVLAVNLCLVLMFAAAGVSAFAVTHALLQSVPRAMLVGLLFGGLHFLYVRHVTHLAATQIFVAPPIFYVCYRVFRDGGWRPSKGLIALMATIGASFVTYIAFAGVMLGSLSVITAVRSANWRPLARTALLLIVMTGTSAIFLSPALVHRIEHGPNFAMTTQSTPPHTLDQYALRLVDVVLPPPERLRAAPAGLERLSVYQAAQIGGQSAYSGVLAGVGLLALVVTMGSTALGERRALGSFTALFLVLAILWAVPGGLDALLALPLPQIRSYHRISVFIAFAAFLNVGLLLELVAKRARRLGGFAATSSLAAFGLWDQEFAAPREPNERWESDKRFFGDLERRFPAGVAMLCLPRQIFPESVGPGTIEGYDGLRPYLHTKAMRFSYGALEGTPAAYWHEPMDDFVGKVDVDALLARAHGAGFRAILVDRAGITDTNRPFFNKLPQTLRPVAIASSRYDVYDLGSSDLARGVTREAPIESRAHASYGDGFYWPEMDGKHRWAWAANRATLWLENFEGTPRQALVRFHAVCGYQHGGHLSVHANGVEQTFECPSTGADLSLHLKLPPGRSDMRLSTDAELRPRPPRDERLINFGLFDVSVSVQ